MTYNAKDDCCFESGYALQPLLEAAGPVFRLFGKADSLRSHVNEDPGTHNYEVDNRQALYRMLGDFFFAGKPDFDAKEIPSDGEVKTAEQLNVELPVPNEDFHTLALALSQNLPRDGDLPKDAAAAGKWQTDDRQRLREVVRAKDYKVIATEAGRETKGNVSATYWRLMMDSDWTVPVVELTGQRAEKTAILVADAGRQAGAAIAAQMLNEGYRVLAVDPFYLGESRITQRDWLFALLIATVGDRSLGLQASQLAAVARWTAGRNSDAPVTLAAIGPRSSIASLVAGGLETRAIAAVELRESFGSLKEIIERNMTVSESPELFCFGLLECCDVKQLIALVAPRPVRLIEPSDRAKQELAGLTAWYQLVGSPHDPLSP